MRYGEQVIPAKAGIQARQLISLDSGFCRNDGQNGLGITVNQNALRELPFAVSPLARSGEPCQRAVIQAFKKYEKLLTITPEADF